MPFLARRNLFHDDLRLAMTLTGVVFAVLVITAQVGLFFGFANTTSSTIDDSGAEVWATSLRNFDQAAPPSDLKLYRTLAVPGVAGAQKHRAVNRKF